MAKRQKQSITFNVKTTKTLKVCGEVAGQNIEVTDKDGFTETFDIVKLLEQFGGKIVTITVKEVDEDEVEA